jgi:hypothetical protein
MLFEIIIFEDKNTKIFISSLKYSFKRLFLEITGNVYFVKDNKCITALKKIAGIVLWMMKIQVYI